MKVKLRHVNTAALGWAVASGQVVGRSLGFPLWAAWAAFGIFTAVFVVVAAIYVLRGE